MEIHQEKKDQLEAVIKVRLKEEDYRENVDKELKNVQKKAQMPGFRSGKVPMGMVKKLYGKSVLVEEVNKILADAVYNYIKDNEVNVLGNPLPDLEKANNIDWDNQTEFEFEYEVGLSPDVDLDLNEDIEVDYHKIIVEDEVVDNYVKDICKRYGKMTNPGVSEAEDVLYGEFVEMADETTPKTEGHTHKSNLMIQYVRDEDVKNQLIGAKPGAEVVFDVLKATGSETEAAAMTGLKKEDLGNYGPLFRFTIESISRVEPAELNQELFAKAMPDDDIQTEEQFREALASQIGKQYQADADKHFKNLVMEKLLEVTELPLPEEFLKKWLLDTNKEELTEEKVENEFDQFSDSFRWQLLENHLIKKYEIEVKPEEVNKHLEDFIRAQLKQYGQQDVSQEVLDEYVKNIASNKDEVKKVYDHLFDQKLMGLFKEKLKLNEIETGFDDFVKLVTEKYKADKADKADDSAGKETEK